MEIFKARTPKVGLPVVDVVDVFDELGVVEWMERINHTCVAKCACISSKQRNIGII